jgi:hypothetical protein
MRVVVYDDETMEPITAITLPKWMTDRLKAHELIKVPYMPRVMATFDPNVPLDPVRTYAEIWFESFHRNGERHWFCFTRDGEHALRLKSVFLAGQMQAVLDREQAAFSEGVLKALTAAYGIK